MSESLKLHTSGSRMMYKRNPKEPPEPVEPVYAQKHKLCWWLPQGIEVKMVLYDPDQPDGEMEI